MKKIYLLLFTLIGVTSIQAQLSLTKTFNDPVFGDQYNRNEYDSVIVVPKSLGTNQLWDFSGCTQNANVLNTTFATVASGTNSANYVGATIVEMDGLGGYTYYKSTATEYELVGAENTSLGYNYSANTAMGWAWPTSYGYLNTDTYSGTASSNSGATGTAVGSVTTSASGTGTIVLPGGMTLTNILQLKVTNTFTLNYSAGAFVLNIAAIDYNYFHSSQKFPVLTVSYSSANGSNANATIRVTNFVMTGVNDVNFDSSLSIFPNPTKNNFNVKLQNVNNENCKVEVMNTMGSIVKSVDLGNATEISNNISISNLSAGIYFVKTTLGDKVSNRKLIVE